MKKYLYRLYFLFRFGGWYYVWVGISSKIFGHEHARQLLHDKTIKINPEKYESELTKIYSLKMGEKLDIKNPRTFNEKIQWLKLHDATPLKTTLTDKYLVREWIKEKIGEQYLIPLIGVWDKFDDIKIDELPDSFVLKANHGCGWNVIVKDKEKINWKEIQENFDIWMSFNFAFAAGFQMHYLNIPPKIVAEQYIENGDGNLYDYKIHCFHGKPEYIQIMGDRDLEAHRAKHAFYNTEWILQPFSYSDQPPWEAQKEKPAKLDEMLQLASILCEGFDYVRVDLYELDNGEIKFGEMTFTPRSGYFKWVPPETNKIWGNKIKLSL